MLNDFFATKIGMTQAWTTSGKRLAITRCKADDLPVVGIATVKAADKKHNNVLTDVTIAEVGVGRKKLANMAKPLQSKLSKSGFSFGVRSLKGITVDAETTIKAGDSLTIDQTLSIGDVVQVQGVSKGRGFAGAVKRHGFHGGPKTHGQSDRHRAVGAIGQRTTPGRVFLGKRMPGRYGGETKTVSGLVVVHIDPATKEVWLSGPVPGMITSQVMIRKTGENKTIELDRKASGLPETVAETAEQPASEEVTE